MGESSPDEKSIKLSETNFVWHVENLHKINSLISTKFSVGLENNCILTLEPNSHVPPSDYTVSLIYASAKNRFAKYSLKIKDKHGNNLVKTSISDIIEINNNCKLQLYISSKVPSDLYIHFDIEFNN